MKVYIALRGEESGLFKCLLCDEKFRTKRLLAHEDKMGHKRRIASKQPTELPELPPSGNVSAPLLELIDEIANPLSHLHAMDMDNDPQRHIDISLSLPPEKQAFAVLGQTLAHYLEGDGAISDDSDSEQEEREDEPESDVDPCECIVTIYSPSTSHRTSYFNAEY